MKHSCTGTRKLLAAGVCLAAMLAAGGRAAAAEENKPAADGTVVLDGTSLWRQFQVAGASHRRDATGKLVRCEVHPMDPASVAQGRSAKSEGGVSALQFSTTSKDAFWSAPPPSDWAGAAFDDRVWPRVWLPQPAVWFRLDGGNSPDRWFERSNRPYDPVLVLARGKFEISSESQESQLSRRTSDSRVFKGWTQLLSCAEFVRPTLIQ